MLGQEDNPNRLKAEIERAKIQPSDTAPAVESQAKQSAADQPAEDFDVVAAEQALYNPRSYLAKSVPKRMAIISAGVIMNVIFAFFMAVGAYYLGIEQIVCSVGRLFPGEAAWKAGLRPGDTIEEIAGKQSRTFQRPAKVCHSW